MANLFWRTVRPPAAVEQSPHSTQFFAAPETPRTRFALGCFFSSLAGRVHNCTASLLDIPLHFIGFLSNGKRGAP